MADELPPNYRNVTSYKLREGSRTPYLETGEPPPITTGDVIFDLSTMQLPPDGATPVQAGAIARKMFPKKI